MPQSRGRDEERPEHGAWYFERRADLRISRDRRSGPRQTSHADPEPPVGGLVTMAGEKSSPDDRLGPWVPLMLTRAGAHNSRPHCGWNVPDWLLWRWVTRALAQVPAFGSVSSSAVHTSGSASLRGEIEQIPQRLKGADGARILPGIRGCIEQFRCRGRHRQSRCLKWRGASMRCCSGISLPGSGSRG